MIPKSRGVKWKRVIAREWLLLVGFGALAVLCIVLLEANINNVKEPPPRPEIKWTNLDELVRDALYANSLPVDSPYDEATTTVNSRDLDSQDYSKMSDDELIRIVGFLSYEQYVFVRALQICFSSDSLDLTNLINLSRLTIEKQRRVLHLLRRYKLSTLKTEPTLYEQYGQMKRAEAEKEGLPFTREEYIAEAQRRGLSIDSSDGGKSPDVTMTARELLQLLRSQPSRHWVDMPRYRSVDEFLNEATRPLDSQKSVLLADLHGEYLRKRSQDQADWEQWQQKWQSHQSAIRLRDSLEEVVLWLPYAIFLFVRSIVWSVKRLRKPKTVITQP